MYSDSNSVPAEKSKSVGCNALASIKCILTVCSDRCQIYHGSCCNALASIKCILTSGQIGYIFVDKESCNALASIKCILTNRITVNCQFRQFGVVMPLRALSVF